MKKKNLMTVLLFSMMTLSFMACSSDESVADTNENNPASDQTEVEVPIDSDDTDAPEVPVDDKDSEVDTQEPVEPDDTEDPVVEMVVWETWATQADNDEVCMVVWNETTGTQKILEPRPEGSLDLKKYSYTVQEGDRIAVPKKNSVVCVYVNLDTRLGWEYSQDEKYMELEIKPGEITQIDVILNTEDNYVIEYLFNF